ncbi:MAG TPA: DinB family protein [Dehalococcoidia bacterium]|nr:DinB family protein [Dehalococcoidia bacterium]
MTETMTSPALDKAAIRAGLERTRAAYRELVAAIDDDRWRTPSGNPAFTCGELAWHLASGVAFSAGIIEAARRGKQASVPRFLMPLGYRINEMRIRRGARNATRESVLADYDRHCARLLRLLDEVSDAELAIVKTNYAVTQSVREMFAGPVEHLAEHGAQMRATP